MSETPKVVQPTWRSNVDIGYHQMLNVYGGEEDNDALKKAKSEYGFACQAFKKSSSLQKCSAESIQNAIVNIARTSLTLNPVMQLAYLIPRKNNCTLEISYRGMVKLLKDAKAIHHIEAYMVFEDEEYSFDPATNTLIHKPTYAKTESEHNKRAIHGCYTRAVLTSGIISFCFMPFWELEKVRETSSNKDGGVWRQWRDEMYKKTVVKRHSKTLMTDQPQLLTAMQLDNENNGFSNQPKSRISQAIENAVLITEQDDGKELNDPNVLF